jgi:hypothetical protein
MAEGDKACEAEGGYILRNIPESVETRAIVYDSPKILALKYGRGVLETSNLLQVSSPTRSRITLPS